MTEHKLAVSVDVEDWYHLPAVSGAPFSPYESAPDFLESWDDDYDLLSEPMNRTLRLLERFEITATFFVVADVVDNYPGLVDRIVNHGHKIGCHGLHHECAIHPDTKEPLFTRQEYRRRIKEAKKILEDASGQEITGFRAPNAYVSGWMLDVIEDLGFCYDSSVAKNTFYNKTDSNLVDVDTRPYTPGAGTLTPGTGRELIEFPWPYYDLSIAKLPSAGGPIIRLFGAFLVKRGIKQSLRRGHTIFYFHPTDIARVRFPNVGNTRRRPTFRIGRGEPAEKRIKYIFERFESRQMTDFETLCHNVQKRCNNSELISMSTDMDVVETSTSETADSPT